MQKIIFYQKIRNYQVVHRNLFREAQFSWITSSSLDGTYIFLLLTADVHVQPYVHGNGSHCTGKPMAHKTEISEADVIMICTDVNSVSL